MSEWIYSCLLQLYPALFRETYGQEARQLFRDLLRDERGFWSRLALWIDLVSSVPLAHGRNTRRLVPVVAPRLVGVPSFCVLEDDPLRPSAILVACALVVAAVSESSVLMSRTRTYRPFPAAAQGAVASRRLNSFVPFKSIMFSCGDDPAEAFGSGVPGNFGHHSKPHRPAHSSSLGARKRILMRRNGSA